jgi:molybdate transport system substrate-binding protein
LMRWLLALVILAGCGARKEPPAELHVAAAANLQRAFEAIAQSFEKQSGVKTVPSFGATAQLAQQIENGGPFDVFLAADTEHVDQLVAKGLATDGSRAVYSRGALVLWAPRRADITSIQDLGRNDVKLIGIAKPELAPYGKAAIETLESVHLWPAIEKKAVYGQNISVVAQFADSANTDASFTALALVIGRTGHRIAVPENLHKPIDQAMCIVRTTQQGDTATRFREFLLGAEGQKIFRKFGYLEARSGYPQ